MLINCVMKMNQLSIFLAPLLSPDEIREFLNSHFVGVILMKSGNLESAWKLKTLKTKLLSFFNP